MGRRQEPTDSSTAPQQYIRRVVRLTLKPLARFIDMRERRSAGVVPLAREALPEELWAPQRVRVLDDHAGSARMRPGRRR